MAFTWERRCGDQVNLSFFNLIYQLCFALTSTGNSRSFAAQTNIIIAARTQPGYLSSSKMIHAAIAEPGTSSTQQNEFMIIVALIP